MINIGYKTNIIKPGIYCLGFNGAVGKTYLYKLMSTNALNGDKNAIAFTADSRFSTNTIIDMTKASKAFYVLLDRADLYMDNELRDFILNHNKAFLIDAKEPDIWRKLGGTICTIKRTPDLIEVRAWY